MIIQGLFHLFSYLSILLCVFALLSKKPGFLYLAAFLAIPLSLYSAAAPAFSYWPLLFPPMILLSGLSIKWERLAIAVLLALPYLFFSVFVMALVMSLQ
ncbi:hypothetical protein [Pseudohongiella nitratireducens]|uniref:hypothetical protein n=1 Tax=Pseudohongiella nitratireducens TaxID=1768907 RepID=UPI00083B7B0B|nr:hypothetical protein [Pseudohongiella nitratireducens]